MKTSILFLAFAGFVAADDKGNDAVKADLKKLEGTWVLESRRINDDPEDKETKRAKSKEWKIVIDGDQWTDEIKGKAAEVLTIKIDPKAKPKTIEMTTKLRSGRTVTRRGLYEIDGDTLTVALGSSRLVPKGLKEPESGCNLTVYKREKK